MKKAEIKINNILAGWLTQDETGYNFIYDTKYLDSKNPEPVSLTLPLQETQYNSKILFPFFDGLIPEGWLLHIAEKNWKLNPRDRKGLLMACWKEFIGAVSVLPIRNISEENEK